MTRVIRSRRTAGRCIENAPQPHHDRVGVTIEAVISGYRLAMLRQ